MPSDIQYGVVVILFFPERSSSEGGKGKRLNGSSLMFPFCLASLHSRDLEASSGVPRFEGSIVSSCWSRETLYRSAALGPE